MKLVITCGNFHIFLLMIKNHQDPRFQIENIYQLDFDLVLEVNTFLKEEKVISLLTEELRYSPFMYLCPFFKVISYDQLSQKGLPEHKVTNLKIAFQ